MELLFAKNLSKLRKENHLTQEQLAEILGVSFAAVSKWERGVAVPEVGMIAEIADVFRVSVDVLIGYEFQNNDKECLVNQLKEYLHDRETKDVLENVEKILKRYPNYFEMVYYSALNYKIRGIYQQKKDYLTRALTLYYHACQLLGQNTDEKISQISINKEIADIYMALEEYEKAIEILEKNNPCRIHHPMIGLALSILKKEPRKTSSYLSEAFMDLTVSQMQIVTGYVNFYVQKKDYQNASAVIEWALGFFEGLKKEGKPNPLNKSEVTLLTVYSSIQLRLQKEDAAKDALVRAKNIAEAFDKAPSYDMRSVRFVSEDTSASSIDDLGKTAVEGIEKIICEEADEKLLYLWESIKNGK